METQNFTSVLSHELRNQLTLIASSLQLVSRQCPSVLEVSFWPQIEQDIQETICLLKDASSFAKSGQFHPKPQNAADFLTELCRSCSPLVGERSIRFCVSLDESLRSAVIFADALKLKEALMNLLLNACDAVSGSEEPEITLTAFLPPKESPPEDLPPKPLIPPDSPYAHPTQNVSTHLDGFSHPAPDSSTHPDSSSHSSLDSSTCLDDFSHSVPDHSTYLDASSHSALDSSTHPDGFSHPAPDHSTHPDDFSHSAPDSSTCPDGSSQPGQTVLHICIRDNGSGIPEEYRSTLFDPFVTHKTHGTGLGLSIVKNIVRQHGGTITFHTCTTLPDTFTEFCLSLPVFSDASVGCIPGT